jgi:hypothetical protein
MAVSLSPFAGAGWQFFDNNGVILSGGKLYVYSAGTTSLATTYTSVTGSTANTNPIILNSSGRLANEIWLTIGLNYKFILKTSTDVLIGTWDNIPAGTTDVADLQAALASSTGAGMIGYLPAGTSAVTTTVQTKLRESVSVFDFMPSDQIAYIQAGNTASQNSAVVTAAIQAAINSFVSTGGVLYAPKGTYKCDSAQITIPPNVFVCGDGRMATIFTSTLTVPLFSITGGTAENYNCGMSELQIQAKNCLTINSGTFDGTKAIVLPRFVRVFFKGIYTSSSGDALFKTANVRDNTNASVSSLLGTNLSVTNTYTDVSSYGIGVFAQAIFDAKFEQCQFVNLGVGVSLNGCDINVFDDCRFQENGWHYYESKTSTYGSQNKITNCDILQNYRAGGVVFNNTNFSRIIDNYFEDSGAWGCYFWLDATQSARIELNRFDDSNYYSTAPAFGITNNMGINNTIQCNDYQLYSYTESPNAVIRNIGFASQDSNHPQLLIYQNNNEYFPKLQNALPGYTVGPIDKALYSPTNCPFLITGNLSPLSTLDTTTTGGSAYAFYNSSAIYASIRFDLTDAVKLAYSFQVAARATSGTTIFFTATHNDINGTLKATLYSAALGGFNTTTYATVSQAITLTASNLTQGDCIYVTWTTNTGYLRGVRLI